MFKKVLVANRGEIALRIIRALREMGVKSVAVCSEADKDNFYCGLADDSICIGPAAAATVLVSGTYWSAGRPFAE